MKVLISRIFQRFQSCQENRTDFDCFSYRFVKAMEDKYVGEGDTAVIECLASGSPTPEFTWFKDDQKLEPTERHFFAADGQKLAVVNALISDSGLYKCVVNNSLGTETQSSVLTVSPFNPGIAPSPPAGDVPPFNNEMLIIIIVAFVCGAVVLASFIWLIVCICRHKSCLADTSEQRHRLDRRFSDPGRLPHVKNEGLPLANEYQIRKPLVVANQYTTPNHRKSSLQSQGYRDQEPRHRRASSDEATEQPLLDQVAVLASESLMQTEAASNVINVIQHDSSSEKDSGTGDSQCISRDNLDEINAVLSPTGTATARDGGGESTMSLTEFEATDLTHLESHTDIEDEDNGCGEAILSASNSILTNSSRNSVEPSDQHVTSPAVIPFRTFKPHRSLSRDFLNCDSSEQHHQTVPDSKFTGSALELNHQNPDPHHAYRGGGKPQSGLEFNEKLLEHSLNSTDYSLQSRYSRSKRPLPRQQQSTTRVAGGGHSLPRSSKKNRHKSATNLLQHQSPQHEIYTTVPLKDDKLF